MRKVGLLAVLFVALIFLNAAPAFADGIDFSSSNQGGAVIFGGGTGSVSGAGIPITAVAFSGNPSSPVSGFNCATSPHSTTPCGHLAFTTGSFLAAGIDGAGHLYETFAGGGSLTITGHVPGGPSSNVTLLTAVFSGPVTVTQLNSGQLQLSGNLTVTAMDPSVQALFPTVGLPASGSSSVLIINGHFAPNGSFRGRGASPDVFVATPEPSGMILLGSGLLGLSALLRRKERRA